jgi:hypothetical protein
MPLPGAGIFLYVSLRLASPPLAPSSPNLPALKIPRYPAAGEQTRRLADRRRDARRALARQHRVFRFHGKNHTFHFLTCLSRLILPDPFSPHLAWEVDVIGRYLLGRLPSIALRLARQSMGLEAPKAIFVAQLPENAQGSSLGIHNTTQWA